VIQQKVKIRTDPNGVLRLRDIQVAAANADDAEKTKRSRVNICKIRDGVLVLRVDSPACQRFIE
jgi:hypothetical protein